MYACNSGMSPSEEKIKNEVNSIYLAEASFEDIKDGNLGDVEGVNVKNVYLSQSPILDTLNVNLSRNSIATITYENLSDDEKEIYDYIGIQIYRENGNVAPFSFPLETLKSLATTKLVANQFSEAIKNENFESLRTITDTGKDTSQEIKDYFTEITNATGSIINYYYYGSGGGEYDAKPYHTHWGTFVYGNRMTQNFHVNIFEGNTIIHAYNIKPLNIDPIDLQ